MAIKKRKNSIQKNQPSLQDHVSKKHDLQKSIVNIDEYSLRWLLATAIRVIEENPSSSKDDDEIINELREAIERASKALAI